jgi:Domain of unknown function (DUF5671)
MSDALDTFVRDALARGADREAIHKALTDAGWPAGEIDAALNAWIDTPFGVPAPRRRVQTSAREAFLYLVMFATLYVVAFNAGALLFAWIERLFPDAAAYGDWQNGLRAVRGWTAGVLIAFPVYLWIARHIGQLLAREPEKRGSAVRRWLTYLTLFLAALVLIGNLVVVVSGLLSGELTVRFVLKALVVFLIAGTVFGHYFSGIRRDESEAPARGAGPRRTLARAAGIAVVAVAGLGLWMSGTPGVARSQALDARRADDLNATMLAVREYGAAYGALPESLGVLRELNPGTPVPDLRDPVTHEPYEYRVIDDSAFELCATFENEAKSRGRVAAQFTDFWQHPAGRTCFRLSRAPSRAETGAPGPQGP